MATFVQQVFFGPIGLAHYLAMSTVLFGLGIFAVVTRRNAVGILMGVELILNAAALNFVAFSRFSSGLVAGQVVAVFVIVLAASEAVVALAIILSLYQNVRTINVDEAQSLKQ